MSEIRFDWDEAKNKANRIKHGVWFEEAQSVFNDPRSRLFLDESHSIEEERFVLIGNSFGHRVLVVIHCYRERDELIRLISARKATSSERTFYEEGI